MPHTAQLPRINVILLVDLGKIDQSIIELRSTERESFTIDWDGAIEAVQTEWDKLKEKRQRAPSESLGAVVMCRCLCECETRRPRSLLAMGRLGIHKLERPSQTAVRCHCQCDCTMRKQALLENNSSEIINLGNYRIRMFTESPVDHEPLPFEYEGQVEFDHLDPLYKDALLSFHSLFKKESDKK
ncbi:uncharacterized protein BO97DRAFT_423803 [Aspergillus homomorphus CBS 101889]|uniref:Uncharacterized protein n=1 Tax=Aspergillus homomorphus (strain CBS 101889) TaxID=1450537 RepID=A0A395HYU9_ASPHC|nr:hypothetical protein BO97DRAFT_423803 [Aspergillus homomorphus CBS 101889]RAL13101.1 hypothetical protein BO97DRAFT_423803 [Aspergillus homomorphus CBS 101889]